MIASLVAALSAVCPVDGVSIGRWDDRATWRIDPKPEATPEQIIAAEAAMAAFNPEKTRLIAYAADKRWRVETGGVIWQGHPIATDRESQSKLLVEFVAMGAGLRPDPSPWKCAAGTWLTASNADMAAIIGAAQTHIRTAFAVERAVANEIAAGTITTRAQIDAAAWPL